jgi:PTS system beta-glucosides-specific IIC component
MTTTDSARDILAKVGGSQNVTALQHCSTRLRFSLADDSLVDEAALKAVPGVIGVVRGPQTQVIVGSKVADFYSALEKLRGPGAATAPAAKQPFSWKRAGAVTMDFVVSVFVPIIPAIAGAGIFKSLLILASAMQWLDKADPTFLVLSAIPDAVFYFLPLLVTYTAAKKLQTNIPLALGLVGLLVFPGFTALIGGEGGASLFGLTVPVIAYNAQVFPPILTVLLLSVVEKYVTKITPGPIRTFFVPLVCFLIVSPIMIFLLGPLGFWLGSMLTTAMLWLYGTLGWVAVALLAAVLPFFISVGMHKAFLPPTIATMAEYNKESFYLVASLAHNLAESGSSFGVAVRTKNKALRGTAISAGVSAFFGITEPALYGVTLQNRRALIAVIAGALAGGAYLGLTLVSAFAVVGPGAASISMYIDADNPWNFINAIIGALISIGTAFVVSFITWSDADSATVKALDAQARAEDLTPSALVIDGTTEIVSPLTGEAIALGQVNDAVFSGGILGSGLAIRPSSGEVRAPISGEVVSLLDSKHAIGIRAADGTEVLVHVGMDTVQLQGAPFTAHVKQGDQVTAGQLVITADLDAIKAAGLDTTTPVVVLNPDAEVTVHDLGEVTAGTPVLAVRQKVAAQ